MSVLCIQVLVLSFGIGMVMPVIGVHAYSLGGGVRSVGLAYGSFFIGRLIFTPVVGRLSDLRGRGLFMGLGFILTSAVGLLFLLAGEVSLLVAARLFQGIAAALTLPVLTACAGIIAPPSSVGRHMGTFNGLRSAGLAGGFAAGVVVLPFDRVSLILPYLMVIASGLLGLALRIAVPRRATQAAISPPRRYWRLLRDPLVRRLALFRLLLAMTAPAVVAFLPALIKSGEMRDRGGEGVDLIQAVGSLSTGRFIVLGAMGVSAGVIQVVLGRLLDARGRFSRIASVISGALMVTAVFWSLPYLKTFGELALASVLAGLGSGALFLPGLLLTVRAARARGMGTVVGLVQLAAALGAVAGSAVAVAAASASPRYLLPTAALFPLLAAACYASALIRAESETAKGATEG